MTCNEELMTQSVKWTTDKLFTIDIKATNEYDYDISDVKISLFNSKMVSSHHQILWVGQISKWFPIIKKNENVLAEFQLVFLGEGTYPFDVIVQTGSSIPITDNLTQFFTITGCLDFLDDKPVDMYTSRKSITGNNYISCLALKTFWVDVTDGDM
ncbi:hypothetical protein RF11_05339 [Thelohanellus kitauei]|uniref:Trs120/TRAPPC9 fourth Ig-like domain-containing protein n=1 Tax=Thelohanellus kitauei TaxID=669202 RepID=A0A0C2J6R6_THEKT|nr:hypothetical protein RF11_05339 [Thelohanellus kitauei]